MIRGADVTNLTWTKTMTVSVRVWVRLTWVCGSVLRPVTLFEGPLRGKLYEGGRDDGGLQPRNGKWAYGVVCGGRSPRLLRQGKTVADPGGCRDGIDVRHLQLHRQLAPALGLAVPIRGQRTGSMVNPYRYSMSAENSHECCTSFTLSFGMASPTRPIVLSS